VRPIETRYKVHRFRSRLEARWAVFFDHLGIKWEYEPEGFVLDDGTHYLPDFWLPHFNNKSGGTFVEVKHEGGDISKALIFAKGLAGNPTIHVLIAEGVSDDRKEYPLWRIGQEWRASFCAKYLPAGGSANGGEYRMYLLPSGESCSSAFTVAATVAARSARFEHGETPR
jgi:hypothetical protein